jgi:ATP-dependent DNA ligase
MLKAKFTFTVDVVVHEVRAEGRNNCTYRLFDNGTWVPAGSVSLEARPEVRPGDVIEVRALYASAEGLLYQPVMQRVRNDKSPTECTVDQLRYTDRTIIELGSKKETP